MATSDDADGKHLENEQYHLGRDSWFTEGTEKREEHHAGPERTIHEPARETPVHEETDVLVVGGGPAGCAAAVAAVLFGAKVALV
jgi:alkyl hydroperoxide reductase subunit AhpF